MRMTKPLDELYRLDNFNDTFALGHYARVLDALDRRSGHLVAFKVMRPEHLCGQWRHPLGVPRLCQRSPNPDEARR